MIFSLLEGKPPLPGEEFSDTPVGLPAPNRQKLEERT